MSYVMTFESLQQDVRRYLERGFSSETDPYVYEQIPRLINMAERRIATELKLQGLINVVQTTLQIGAGTLQKPTRWRDTISFSITTDAGKKVLQSRSYDYCRSYWPDQSVQDEPEFYADYDYDHWLITPPCDVAYAAEIIYYQLTPLLDDNNQTNWLTAHAPSLLLYGTLLEASPFLKNDERIPVWQAMYDRTAQSAMKEDFGKIIDRAAIRQEV